MIHSLSSFQTLPLHGAKFAFSQSDKTNHKALFVKQPIEGAQVLQDCWLQLLISFFIRLFHWCETALSVNESDDNTCFKMNCQLYMINGSPLWKGVHQGRWNTHTKDNLREDIVRSTVCQLEFLKGGPHASPFLISKKPQHPFHKVSIEN